MAICYYCYWGWPKPFLDIYQKYVTLIDDLGESGYDAMHWGVGHVIWEDENFELANTSEEEANSWWEKYGDGKSRAAHDLVMQSLKELASLPGKLFSVPADYEADDEHPENYPPPAELMFTPKR